jgi:hypothetical protein
MKELKKDHLVYFSHLIHLDDLSNCFAGSGYFLTEYGLNLVEKR